jgi:BolA protein
MPGCFNHHRKNLVIPAKAGISFQPQGDSRFRGNDKIGKFMTMATDIERLLAAAFAPQSLNVTDDSAKHAGHAGARPGGQTHFSVMIVSATFAGMNRIARHRAVYSVLGELFDQGLHALVIDAKAPGEI